MSSSRSIHLVRMTCPQCGGLELHRVRFAGRLLSSCECVRCAYRVSQNPEHLRHSYLRDGRHRLFTKPARMWRRFKGGPGPYLRQLPQSAIIKPASLAEEWRSLRSTEEEPPPSPGADEPPTASRRPRSLPPT